VEGKLRWRCRCGLADKLRRALDAQKSELLALLRKEADGDLICRAIERDLGLPHRSLTLWESWRINS
jgi:hypothetical protein